MQKLIKHILITAISFATTFSWASSVKSLDGQPLGLVFSIHQSQETTWISSENGLFQVKGTHVNKIDFSDSEIEGIDIEKVIELSTSKILMTTFGKGVFIFDLETNSLSNLKIESVDSEKNIDNCDEVSNGKLALFITCGKYLVSFDYNNLSLEVVFDDLDIYSRTPISANPNVNDQIFFIGSENKVYTYKNNEVSEIRIGQNKPESILYTSSNKLLIGTNSSILVFDSYYDFETTIELECCNPVSILTENNEGSVLFFNGRLREVNLEKEFQIKDVIRSENLNAMIVNIYDMIIDSFGNTIFAAPLIGIYSVSGIENANKINTIIHKNTPNIQFSASIEDMGLLLGIAEDIVLIPNFSDKPLLVKSNLGFGTAVFVESSSDIFLGIEGLGLLHTSLVEKKTGDYELLLGEIIYKEQEGIITSVSKYDDKILFSVEGGSNPGLVLAEIDKKKIDFLITNTHIDVATVTSKGIIFVAPRSKVNSEIKNQIEIATLNVEEHLLDTSYFKNCLVEDSRGNIWLCTDGGGLIVWDNSTNSVSKIQSKYTANSRFIREVVEDSEGYLWIMTNKGLVRYDHQNKTSFLLGEVEGIADVDFEISASIRLSDDRILVAGDTQNYIIDTKAANQKINVRLNQQTVAQLVELTASSGKKVKLMQKQASASNFPALFDELELNEDDTNLNFKFATNNFLDRDVLGFEYRLMGFENYWQFSSPQSAQVTYSSLPSGNYVFQVRVKDPKSMAYQPPTQLHIKVNPPFWQTWQAYSVYAAVGLVLFILATKIKNLMQKAMQSKLEASIKNATVDLAVSDSKIGSLLRRKESLFASASHELRTPLTLINSPLDKLEETILANTEKSNSKQLDYLRMIKANTLRLTDLVDQILELSKLDGKVSEKKEVFQLDSALCTLIGVLTPMADLKGITITSNITGTARGKLIPGSFDKIVSNILVNAIKYTQDFGSININAYCEEDLFRIDIEDNGPGIDEKDLKIIFKRFTRLESSKHTAGSGLGLALAKELVTLNGGDIRVKSKLNCGTQFSIEFPLTTETCEKPYNSEFLSHLESRVQNHINIEKLTSLSQPSSNSCEIKIVIVEDEPDMRRLLHGLLDDNYKCYVASDGEEALALINKEVPDLILTDLMMPKMNGFDLTKAVREDEVTSHIPIIMLTAKSDPETRIEGWQNNLDEFISKPFINSELLERVQNILALRKMIVHRFIGPVPEDEFDKLVMLPNDQFFNERDKRFFERFKQTIEKHLSNADFSRKEAADQLAISIRQLNRKLTALVGLSFNDYLKKYRLAKVRKAIESGVQITEASYDYGFSSPSYLSNCFKKEYGVSPKTYIDNLKL